MDHRPFEDWLLENKVLAADEKRQLNLHLRNCSSCTALAEVDLALKSTRMVEPATGFVDRFQVRLARRKKALRQRNVWGFLILTVSVVASLVWLGWPVLTDVVRSPVNWLASSLSSLLSLWATLQALFHAGAGIFKVVPGFLPTYVWMVVLFVAGGWCLLWVFSLMKFTKFPQGVK